MEGLSSLLYFFNMEQEDEFEALESAFINSLAADAEVGHIEEVVEEESSTPVLGSLEEPIRKAPVAPPIESQVVVKEPVVKALGDLSMISASLDKKVLQKIAKVCEEIHPNCWDISYDNGGYFGDAKYKITIKFDDVDITNSTNNTHKIRDLFLHIPFWVSEDGEKASFPCELLGSRTTLTLEEAYFCPNGRCYLHSHLRNEGVEHMTRLNHFCMGASDLSAVYGDLSSMGLTSEFGPILRNLLLMLYSVVSWESIEGTPYKYMKRIGSGLSGSNRIEATRIHRRDARLGVFSKLKEDDSFAANVYNINILGKTGVPEVDLNVLEQGMLELEGLQPEVFEGSDGNPVVYLHDTTPETLLRKHKRAMGAAAGRSLLFRKEDIPAKILPPDITLNSEVERVRRIHPDLLLYVQAELTEKLNTKMMTL